MFDPNDIDSVQDHKRRRKARATQEQRDMQAVLGTDEGVRVLARILAMTGWNAASYVPTDALGTAYREGQRNIGLRLYAGITQAGSDCLERVLTESVKRDE